MTVPELAEHLKKLDTATEAVYNELLTVLLEEPYGDLEQQNN